MKKRLLKTMLLLCALIVGSGMVWGQTTTYQHIFSTKPSTGNNVNLSSVSWNISATNLNGYQNSYAGVQFGTKSANGSITLTSSSDWGASGTYQGKTKITEVRLWLNNGSGTIDTYTVTIGGVTATASGTISKNSSASSYEDASLITYTPGTNGNSGQVVINVATSSKAGYICAMEIDCEEPSGGGDKTATTTAVSAPVGFVTDLNGNTGVSAGTLTATVVPNGESALTNPAITWSSTNTSVATVNASTGAVTLWAVGSTQIKAKYDGDETYEGSTGTYDLTVTNSNPGDGSLSKPYTVAEALALISGYSSGSGSSGSVYTKGVVSSIGSMYNSTMLTYNISIDGTNTNTISVFRGKNIGNTDFSSTSDISVNDEVVIYGQLYKYNSTSEINTGNYIYSRNGKIKPTITFGAASYEVAYNGSLTISATSSPSGTIIYSSSDTNIAEINSSTGVVTPHTAGDVTIRATLAEGAGNIEWYEEVTLTVTDGRGTAGIEFANATVTKTWGESYTGQAVTNPNSLTVSYESTVPAVATVNASTGAVTIVKAGTTTIKATFDGNSSYMPAEVSYTLTVNKAAAGLSYATTEFDIELNDDSFVAPTLVNPNGLTVTYASSDEDVAVVDENTGELTYDESAVGTATITASFAGNDNFNLGSASYTINIYDPNAKGTKYNPYTVAEVNTGSYSGDNYVVGYIVGYFNGSASDATTSGTSGTVSNIALSDSPSEIGGANTIAVQLPSGTIRDNWNIYDNAVIGYKVLVYGNITGYFSNKTGVKNTSEITAVSAPAVVTAAGYATFVAKAAVDFTDSNIKAYIAEGKDGAAGVTFSQVNKIPAGTGVLLYKAGGATEDIPVTTASTDNVASNVFVPGTGAAVASVVETTKHNYILNNVGGVVGFYMANDQVVAKNRAYIQIDESIWGASSVREFISLPGFDDDNTTGISTIDNEITDNAIYNLAGQRLDRSQLKRGIYIVNGKKVLVK